MVSTVVVVLVMVEKPLNAFDPDWPKLYADPSVWSEYGCTCLGIWVPESAVPAEVNPAASAGYT